MSLDRNHPVFHGHPLRDRTPPRFRNRFLDDEIGLRTFEWRHRRCICIFGKQGNGRRSLAKRFFQDRGELTVDGNWWLRGIIRLPHDGPFPRGEVDLLIRIIPSTEEESYRGFNGYRRIMNAAGWNEGNAGLFIFTFICARVRRLDSLDFHGMFYSFMRRKMISTIVVGTKSDLRLPEWEALLPYNRFMSETDLRQAVKVIFFYRRGDPPDYVECSVKNDVNVHVVINKALHSIL